jgi:hypothetical protein
MVLGSPHFISPERAIGAKFGPPSDLFSLGVSLYTAIEGRPPFDRGDPFETMRAIVEDEPMPPVRAGAMAPVLAGLLEKDPDRRWTVNQARAALRELMSVSSRQNARGVPVAPRMQVGGRALLGDGEGPMVEGLPAGAYSSAEAGPLDATALAPAGAMPAGRHSAEPAYDSPPAFLGPPPQRSRRRDRGVAATGSTTAGATAVTQLADKARGLWQRAVDTVMSWPRKIQIAAGAGVAVLLVVVLIVAFSGGSGNPTGATAAGRPSASASSTKPSFDTQTFKDPRGMSVNVPAAWKKQSSSTYTNFYNPKDDKERMRLNVENTGNASAKSFLTGAERNLKNKLCDTYSRVGLTDIELDGKAAAQLEYTCDSGDGQRHGIWAAVTSGGKAYHFYMTVPDDDFKADLPIYNEMVSSFQLTADN